MLRLGVMDEAERMGAVADGLREDMGFPDAERGDGRPAGLSRPGLRRPGRR